MGGGGGASSKLRKAAKKMAVAVANACGGSLSCRKTIVSDHTNTTIPTISGSSAVSPAGLSPRRLQQPPRLQHTDSLKRLLFFLHHAFKRLCYDTSVVIYTLAQLRFYCCRTTMTPNYKLLHLLRAPRTPLLHLMAYLLLDVASPRLLPVVVSTLQLAAASTDESTPLMGGEVEEPELKEIEELL
ncbi:hypothetical protein ACFX15_037045 [Malus domestica]